MRFPTLPIWSAKKRSVASPPKDRSGARRNSEGAEYLDDSPVLGGLPEVHRHPVGEHRVQFRYFRGAGARVRQGPGHGRLLLPGEVHQRALRRISIWTKEEDSRPSEPDDSFAAFDFARPCG